MVGLSSDASNVIVPGVTNAPRYESDSSSYLNYSRAIPQPPADTSEEVRLKGEAAINTARAQELTSQGDLFKAQAGLLKTAGMLEETGGDIFKSIGKVVETGTKAAETIIEDAAKKMVRDRAEPIRNQFQSQIDAVKNGEAPLNVLGGDQGPELPGGIKGLGPGLDLLDEARANGKISPTAYYGRLDEIAQSVRARFPEHKDLIDKEFERVTGVIPANAKLKSALDDVNSYLAKNQGQQEKIDTEFRHAVGTGHLTNSTYVAWKNGQRSEDAVREELGLVGALKLNYELDGLRRTKKEGDLREKQTEAQLDAESNAAASAQVHLQTKIMTPNGLNSPAAMFELARSGKVTGDVAVQLGQQMRDSMVNWKKERWDLWSQVGPNGEPNFITQMGGADKAKAILDKHGMLFESMADSLSKENVSAAGMAAARATAIQKGRELDFKLTPLGQKLGDIKLLSDTSPEWFKDFGVKNPKVLSLNPEVNGFLEDRWMELSLPAKPGDKTSLLGAVDAAQRGKITNTSFYDNLFKLSGELTNPKATPDQKALWVDRMYDPVKNRGLLNRFQPDRIDEHGNYIPGQYKVFNDLYSPDKEAAVWELNKTKPGVYDKFKKSAENSYAEDLFGKEILDLNQIQKIPGTQLKFENGNWKLDIIDPKLVRARARNPGDITDSGLYSQLANIAEADVKIEKLNGGLYPFKQIAARENTKGDPDYYDTYVLKLFSQKGFTQGKTAEETSIFKAMYNAFIASRNEPASKQNIKPVELSQEDFLKSKADPGTTRLGPDGKWYTHIGQEWHPVQIKQSSGF